jgi:hypothetical protein
MRDIIKLLYLVLFYLSLGLLISCKEMNTNHSEKKSIKDEKAFEDKLNNNPKLFSKFWADMSKADFNKVVSILKKERKIKQSYVTDSLFYDLNHYTMYLDSYFKNGKLKKINLFRSLITASISEEQELTPYKIYREKYNLPRLVRKDKYYQRRTFPNSEYRATYQVYLENNTTESIPNSLIDNYSNKYEEYSRNNEKETRLALSQKKLEISKNDKIKIILEEVPSIGMKRDSKGGTDLVYSLEDWKYEIPLGVRRRYNIGPNQITFDGDGYKSFNDKKPMETIGNYLIRKNSKFVTKCYYQNFDLKITYVTNDYYKTEQGQKLKSENERKNLDKRIEEANKSESKRRRNEAIDDI